MFGSVSGLYSVPLVQLPKAKTLLPTYSMQTSQEYLKAELESWEFQEVVSLQAEAGSQQEKAIKERKVTGSPKSLCTSWNWTIGRLSLQ